jgi:hypothetical protein
MNNAVAAARLKWSHRTLVGAAVGIECVLQVNRIGPLTPILRFLHGLLFPRRYECLVELRDGAVKLVWLDRIWPSWPLPSSPPGIRGAIPFT